ncbi:hypothetical protein [Brevundimonas sp. PAMC22021]|uniref:hypothetical protein n=1 Tax=Brevundimonas sp. PAMC22021 TaxID=2861285 RepID=UPI001C62640E|nr:hypothetical protein [Brevundimonas sp. PAMC22021]QYF86872.1 hypothetical protein KY493_13870 [Brevundimonas sp. PAMC22021]
MDFLKILRSFEEFLFEAASWLLFYPLTMWRIIRRPLTTMEYSDREQTDVEDHRYDDALSPPLVLLVTIVLCNVISSAAHVPLPPNESDLLKAVTSSQQNLVLFRSLVFSLVPLISALVLLRRQNKRIARETLRASFYAQCYLAAPCAACVSAGGVMLQRPDMSNAWGLAIIAAGAAWFVIIQTAWFAKKLNLPMMRAAWVAVSADLSALVYLVLILIPVGLI